MGLGETGSERKAPAKQRERPLGFAPAVGQRAKTNEDLRIVARVRRRWRFLGPSLLRGRRPRP